MFCIRNFLDRLGHFFCLLLTLIRYGLTSASWATLATVSLSRYLMLRWPAEAKAVLKRRTAQKGLIMIPWTVAVLNMAVLARNVSD